MKYQCLLMLVIIAVICGCANDRPAGTATNQSTITDSIHTDTVKVSDEYELFQEIGDYGPV